MKAILSILIAFTITAQAQVFLPHRKAVGALQSAISLPQAGIQLWWVASDLPNGNVSNWVDRIQGWSLHATNGFPVKTNNYVVWNGTTAADLETTPNYLEWGTNGWSYVFILAPVQSKSTTLQTLWTDGSSNPAWYLNYTKTNCIDQFNATVDYVAVTNYYTSGYLTNDAIIRHVSYDSGTRKATMTGYLNGVANYTNNNIAAVGHIYGFGGRTKDAPTTPLWANVYELIVYTNLAAADVAEVHKYATNTYGYSP